MNFKELGVAREILKALGEQGYTVATPIQSQSIPILLEGHDLLGSAQTGTGKTAAFAIPILQQLMQNRGKSNKKKKIRALILAPTRELAIQIAESFTNYGAYTGLQSTAIYGGVKQNRQVKKLKQGIDILAATPGRLLDLIQQGYVDLSSIEHFVLDEADRMLDMGFIRDITKLIKMLPEKRQSLFFSATMTKELMRLSKKIIANAKKVRIAPEQATAERVNQSVFFVKKGDKRKLLKHLLETELPETTLVFSRTKYGADKIVKRLNKSGFHSAAIHGNKSQNKRQRVLKGFKNGNTDILVATDIASRGIDVENITHVINYDLPNVPETYVHRIGRTGRAKASGIAWSFCSGQERDHLKSIQKHVGETIPENKTHPFVDDTPEAPKPKKKKRNKNKSRSSKRRKNKYRGKRRNKHRRKKRRKN